MDGHDEIRFYPRETRLDNKFAKIVRVQSQVFVLDMLDDQLVVFGADALVTIYELTSLDNSKSFLHSLIYISLLAANLPSDSLPSTVGSL